MKAPGKESCAVNTGLERELTNQVYIWFDC